MVRRNPPGLPLPDSRDVFFDEPDMVLDRLIWLADLALNDPKGKLRSYWERQWADLYMSWHYVDADAARVAVKDWRGLPAEWLNRKGDIRLTEDDTNSRAPDPCYRGYVRQELETMPPMDPDGFTVSDGEEDEHGQIYHEAHFLEDIDHVDRAALLTVCTRVGEYLGYDVDGDAVDGFTCSLESDWGDEFYRRNIVTFRRYGRNGKLSLRSNLCLVEVAYIEWHLHSDLRLRQWFDARPLPAGNSVSQQELQTDEETRMLYDKGALLAADGKEPSWGQDARLIDGWLYGVACREHNLAGTYVDAEGLESE